MTDEMRYGIIGTGHMGVEHIENINFLAGAKVVAVADSNPGSLENGQRASGLGPGAAFADYRELLRAAEYDVLVVATPNHTHAEVILDVLETPAHLLIEKPLCTTVEDCKRVAAAAADHDGIVWMALEYRFIPAVARLIDEVDNGVAGDVKMVSIREHRYPFLSKVDNWNRYTRNTGGTLVEKCCHFFDLMNVIVASDPVRVMASGAQDVNHLDESHTQGVPDMIDNAFVLVDYANGARAMLDLCMFAEGSANEQELAVTGDAGKVEAFVPESVVRIGKREDRSTRTIEVSDDRIEVAGRHYGSSYLEHVELLDAIRGGRPPKVTIDDGLLAVAVGVAGHRSIDERRPVNMTEVL